MRATMVVMVRLDLGGSEQAVGLHKLDMQVVAVRLDWGGIEWAVVGLRELETQVMLLERQCQKGEGTCSRRKSKLDLARVRSQQAQLRH